jgi:DNA mismatch repair protein MutL
LFPELLELSKLEVEALKSVKDQFKHLGFYIEHFGGETYQIRAIPSALPLSRAIKAVKDFLDSIGDEGKGEGDMVKVQDTIAKAWANTNAYQAGDKLKPEEMAALVNQLMLTEEPLKSPYGHPTLLRFTLDELAKKFRH